MSTVTYSSKGHNILPGISTHYHIVYNSFIERIRRSISLHCENGLSSHLLLAMVILEQYKSSFFIFYQLTRENGQTERVPTKLANSWLTNGSEKGALRR